MFNHDTRTVLRRMLSLDFALWVRIAANRLRSDMELANLSIWRICVGLLFAVLVASVIMGLILGEN